MKKCLFVISILLNMNWEVNRIIKDFPCAATAPLETCKYLDGAIWDVFSKVSGSCLGSPIKDSASAAVASVGSSFVSVCLNQELLALRSAMHLELNRPDSKLRKSQGK